MTNLRHEMHMCEHCRARTELHYVEEYDEYWCENCLQDRAENAYERLIEDFHDGGSNWPDLRRDQEFARKLK